MRLIVVGSICPATVNLLPEVFTVYRNKRAGPCIAYPSCQPACIPPDKELSPEGVLLPLQDGRLNERIGSQFGAILILNYMARIFIINLSLPGRQPEA